MRKIVSFVVILMMIVFVVNVQGGDCPRFRGPEGDGQFAETGLLKKWPEDGPKLAWSVDKLGKGYSSAGFCLNARNEHRVATYEPSTKRYMRTTNYKLIINRKRAS